MENEFMIRYDGIIGSYKSPNRPRYSELIQFGLLEIGKNTRIDEGVWICHYERDMIILPVKIGENCIIRAGSVIYSGVIIGDDCSLGHHVVVRERCKIGNGTSIGTGVKVENDTVIGNHVSIETQSHVTANALIEDFVFWGACVVSNNDFGMKYRREGHGEGLKGCIVRKGARIGSNAILMAGVEIGEHSVINAGETVRKNVPPCVMMFTKQNKVIYKKIKPDLKED